MFSLESSGSLLGLYWYSSKRQLVSVTKASELFLHGEVEGQTGWQQLVRLKIGGGAAADGPALMVAWVGGQTLASATGKDDTVRMYDLDTEDNYILRIGTAHFDAYVFHNQRVTRHARVASSIAMRSARMWMFTTGCRFIACLHALCGMAPSGLLDPT